MQRRGQRTRFQRRDPPAGLDEIELAKETDAVAHPQPLIQVEQVREAGQQHVLAVVDDLGAIGERIRRRASPEEPARLEEIDVKSGAGERGGSREARQTPARYEDAGHGRARP